MVDPLTTKSALEDETLAVHVEFARKQTHAHWKNEHFETSLSGKIWTKFDEDACATAKYRHYAFIYELLANWHEIIRKLLVCFHG